jgi:3',5'-cyclic AMP phosphodiesterase CpdA
VRASMVQYGAPVSRALFLASEQSALQHNDGSGRLTRLFLAIVIALLLTRTSVAQTVIAQISDVHLCSSKAPHAATNLSTAVQMINKSAVDTVIVSGDIGENKTCWLQAKSILANLKAPVRYVPGNHDVHTLDVSTYRSVFGADYYRFRVKNVDAIVIDSQLLGNYDNYSATTPPPLPAYTQAESDKMMTWLNSLVPKEQDAILAGYVVIAVQHIPVARDSGFPPGTLPYWIISDPYRTEEMKALHALGIKDVLTGHWHSDKVFSWGKITWHVSPSTGWLPFGGALGFAVHTVWAAGNVSTEFVDLPNAVP